MSLTGKQLSIIEKLFGPQQVTEEKPNYITTVLNDASSRTNINQIRGVTQAGSTASGIPKHVTNVSAIVSDASAGSTSKIVITFRRDPTDNTFSGVTVYAKGYQGNQSPTQVGFGIDAPLTVILNNTGESVSLIVQATGNGGSAPMSNAPSCGVKLPASSSGGFGTQTTTNLTPSQVQSITKTTSSKPFPDPTKWLFGRTNVDLIGSGIQAGDPQVVYDSANAQWVMFWYQYNGSVVSQWKAVSTSLEGPWTGATQITSLNNYHKARVLCDVKGNPVQIGGLYYAYAVFFNGPLTSKQIFLFSQSTLQGNSWAIQNSGNPVIAKAGAGGAGIYDDFSTDAPNPVYDTTTGKIYVWYMGAPGTSQSDFGLATRVLVAVASSPTGTYNKASGYVMGPSTNGSNWDFGWMGGTQLLQQADGTYFILYNAGNTRPSSSGTEPATSLWGFATAPTLTGAWTRVAGPFIQLSNLPQWPTGTPNSGSVGTIVDTTNIWRGYAVLDPVSNRWYVFYNTGNGASPVERITYARQGLLSFSNGAYVGGNALPSPNNGYILQITGSEQQIPGSQVFLRPGLYRVHYAVDEGDFGGTTPKVNIALFIRPNGTKQGAWSQSFLGSYAFENDDYEVEDVIAIPFPAGPSDSSQYVDASLQCIGGTPTSATQARNLRVYVEQISTA